MSTPKRKARHPGREGDRTSLHPLTFDEAIDALAQPLKDSGSTSEPDPESESESEDSQTDQSQSSSES